MEYQLQQTGQEVQDILNQAPTTEQNLQSEIERSTTKDQELEGAIADEKQRAEGVESGLRTDIGNEVIRAEGAEGNLQTAIINEKNRAEGVEGGLRTDVDGIEGKIPTGASDQNKLATEGFVNSSISTNTADFKGTYNSIEELQTEVPTATANDYAFVISTDASGNTVYNRYKYVAGEGWQFEYALNNSSFTAAQWSAINSAITAALVAKLNGLPTAAELTQRLNAIIDSVATEKTRAEGIEAGLRTDVNTNAVAIVTEKNRAQGVEGTLTNGLNAEILARQNADTALQQNINAEALLRDNGDDALQAEIDEINAKIPTQASASNQLADKAFVNSSIATNTGEFKGTYNSLAELQAVTNVNANDYGFVIATDGTGNTVYNRYKYVTGQGWVFEYALNNSSFTAAQWGAINSGITAALAAKINGLPDIDALNAMFAAITSKIPANASSSNKLVDYAQLVAALAAKQDNLIFDNVPTENSNNPVKSGGVYSAIAAVTAAVVGLQSSKQDVLTFDQYPTPGSNNPVRSTGIYSSIENAVAPKANQTDLDNAVIRISTNEVDIAQLQAAYRSLTQNDVVPVAPTDTWPVANPQENVIYRVADRTNTPPQYYTDYMWNGSLWVLMATYNNAIDPRPKKNSQNLVTSGGVFDNMGALDVSELNATENPHTLAQYADLSAALAAIPTDYQKGGMSIKFVQSSDNKYVQYFLTKNEWSASEADWEKINLEEEVSQLGQENQIINITCEKWYKDADVEVAKRMDANGNFEATSTNGRLLKFYNNIAQWYTIKSPGTSGVVLAQFTDDTYSTVLSIVIGANVRGYIEKELAVGYYAFAFSLAYGDGVGYITPSIEKKVDTNIADSALKEDAVFKSGGVSSTIIENSTTVDDIDSNAEGSTHVHAIIEVSTGDVIVSTNVGGTTYAAAFLLDENRVIVKTLTGTFNKNVLVVPNGVKYVVLNANISNHYFAYKSYLFQSIVNYKESIRPIVLRIENRTDTYKFVSIGKTRCFYNGNEFVTINSGAQVSYSDKNDGVYILAIDVEQQSYVIFSAVQGITNAAKYIYVASFTKQGNDVTINDSWVSIINTTSTPTAGDSDYLDNIKGYLGIKYAGFDFLMQGSKRINPNTGAVESNGNYKASDLIPVTTGNYIVCRLATASSSSSSCLVGYADNEGSAEIVVDAFPKFTSNQILTRCFKIPEGIDYVRYSYNIQLIDGTTEKAFFEVISKDSFERVLRQKTGVLSDYVNSDKIDIKEFVVKEDSLEDASVILSYIGNAAIKGRQEFNLENSIVRAFLHSFIYDNSDYSYTNILDYYRRTASYNRSHPFPAVLSIDKNSVDSSIVSKTIVETYYDGTLFRTDEFNGLNLNPTVYNLVPSRKYTYIIKYKTTDNLIYTLADGEIFTTGTFRALYVDGMFNFRDLGGYPTINGKTIKYGKLYRSAEVKSDNPAQGDITAKGINEVVNNLNIDVEIDFGDYSSTSPLSSYLEFVTASLNIFA